MPVLGPCLQPPCTYPSLHLPFPVQSGQSFQPPRTDVNSPDLYIPLMSMWSYVIGICALQLLHHKYKPDLVYSTVSNTSNATS